MSLLELLEKEGKVLDFLSVECDHTVFFVSNSIGAYMPLDGALIEEVLEEIREHLDNILLVKVRTADLDENYIVLFRDANAWYKFSFGKCPSTFMLGDMLAGEQFLIEETFEGNRCYDRESGELRLLEKCKGGWI